MTQSARAAPARHRFGTRKDSFTDGGVVEVGWQDVTVDADGRWVLNGDPGSRLMQPGCPIFTITAAVHHIMDEDAAGASLWPDLAPEILQRERPVALAAHRASFDKRWCR